MHVAADNEPSAIWESQQVRFPTHTLTALEMIWRGSSNNHSHILGKAHAFGQIYCLWFSHLASKRRKWIHCSTCQAMCNIKISACVHGFFHLTSDKPLPFILPLCLAHTHSHGEVSTHRSVNMFEFEQGVEISPKPAWVKWDCHSKVSWDHIIMLRHCVGKFGWHSHVHRYVRTYKNTQWEAHTKLTCVLKCDEVSIMQL